MSGTMSDETLQRKNQEPAGEVSPVEMKQITITRRMCLSTMWTIFGLVFFYLMLVFISSQSKNITLERLAQNGWPRFASRSTAAVTSVVFSIHLLMPSSSIWSLFSAVMTACAHFCHIVVLASDLVVFSDEVIVNKMFRQETTHPIFRTLPLHTAHYVGGLGYICLAVIILERTYGSALGKRQKSVPAYAAVCCFVVWCVFNLFFVDRLVAAVLKGKRQVEISYPTAFILFLWFSGIVKLLRERKAADTQTAIVSDEKKAN